MLAEGDYKGGLMDLNRRQFMRLAIGSGVAAAALPAISVAHRCFFGITSHKEAGQIAKGMTLAPPQPENKMFFVPQSQNPAIILRHYLRYLCGDCAVVDNESFSRWGDYCEKQKLGWVPSTNKRKGVLDWCDEITEAGRGALFYDNERYTVQWLSPPDFTLSDGTKVCKVLS
jgi:hypothetical protein